MKKARRIGLAVLGALIVLTLVIYGILFRSASAAMTEEQAAKLMWTPVVAIGILLLLFGLFLLAAACVRHKQIKQNYTTPVTAECVELKLFEPFLHRVPIRQPVYRYIINGVQYTVEREAFDSYGFHTPKIGETRTILIDESNPGSYADLSEERFDRIFMYVAGAVLAAGSFLSLLFILSGLLQRVLIWISTVGR